MTVFGIYIPLWAIKILGGIGIIGLIMAFIVVYLYREFAALEPTEEQKQRYRDGQQIRPSTGTLGLNKEKNNG